MASQRHAIEERQAALYAGEIAIPADVVDEVLRSGGNRDRSQLRLIYNFMTDPTPEEAAEFVKREYGVGGKGFTIDGRDYAVWWDEPGMQIAAGHTVKDKISEKAFLSWPDVSARIGQLLAQGEYAPQVVLDAARGNALKEHAAVLIYMERDLADGVAERFFDDLSVFQGGFPEVTERLAQHLDSPEYVADLNQRLERLASAYAEDAFLIRFRHYAPDRVLQQFQKFAREAVPYQARDEFAWQEHDRFITEDEVDAFLTRGGPYSDGRLTVYAYFKLTAQYYSLDGVVQTFDTLEAAQDSASALSGQYRAEVSEEVDEHDNDQDRGKAAKKPHQKANRERQSVLQALRSRQAKQKAREQAEKPKRVQTHKQGEHEL